MLIYIDEGYINNILYKIEIFGDNLESIHNSFSKVRSNALMPPFDSFFTLAEKFDLNLLNNGDKFTIKLEGPAHFFYFFIKKLSWYLDLENIKFDCEFDSKDYFIDNDFLFLKMKKFVLSVIEKKPWAYNYLFCEDCALQEASNNLLGAKKDPLGIDFVIPVKDTPVDILQQCLKSLETQLYPIDRVFLVDDNESLVLTAEIFSQLPFQVNIIRGSHEGVAAARNIGAIQGNNALIQFIDSDDYVLPGFVSKQRIFHQNHPEVSASGTWLQAFGSHSRIYPQWENVSPLSMLSCLPPAGVLMWKRNILNELKYFNSYFKTGFEDFDLVTRATALRFPIVILDEILYRYRRGGKSLSQSWSKLEYEKLFIQVLLNLQQLCSHEFKNYLKLNKKYNLSLFQSNPDFIFGEKQNKKQNSFVKLIITIGLSFYYYGKRHLKFFNKLTKLVPLSLRMRFGKNPPSTFEFDAKVKYLIEKLWRFIPKKIKLIFFRRKYVKNKSNLI